MSDNYTFDFLKFDYEAKGFNGIVVATQTTSKGHMHAWWFHSDPHKTSREDLCAIADAQDDWHLLRPSVNWLLVRWLVANTPRSA